MDKRSISYASKINDVQFASAGFESIISFLEKLTCRTIAERIVIIVLLLIGISAQQISDYIGCSSSTVYFYRDLLSRTERPENLAEILYIKKGSGRKNRIKSIEQAIIDGVDKHNFFCLMEIHDWIKDTFNIDCNLKYLSNFLRAHNIRKLKVGSIPFKANAVEQHKFYDEIIAPCINEAKAGKCNLFYADAAHFVMGCDFEGAIYGSKRRFIKTQSGRSRYNVLGALNFCTKEVITVTNGEKNKSQYIDSNAVISLLDKIAEEYPEQRNVVILDNAKYQRCNYVKEHAEKLSIELEFLPSYSPNLNLIERIWRYVKGELRKRAWTDFDEFKSQIDELVSSTTGQNREKINTLIGEKVQFYDGFSEIDPHTLVNPLRPKKAQEIIG